MNHRFKKHQKAKIINPPLEEDLELYEEVIIKKGMLCEINIILPNGQYHIRIFDEVGKVVAYAAIDEESLEAI